jgi:lipid-A-disaccharide synthase
MGCDLFLIAGEKSADLHGEKLLEALKKINPALHIAGVAGPKMRAQGMQCVLPMEEFQVMGFVDVFFALPKLIRHFYFIAREIKRLQPKVVLTIDYPGLNLRLHKHLKKKGFQGKQCHYICPSVWAWGKKRIPLMADTLNLLLAILPFEKELFKNTSLPVAYVGHPLVTRLHSYTYQPLSFPEGKKIVALFPGSRKKELERNLPLILRVCQDLAHPDLHFALSLSEERFRPLVEEIIAKHPLSNLTLIPGTHSYELMKAAHIAIAKSGTVTLELALHRVPTVVIYAVSRLDLFIALQLLGIYLPFYCLVNIIAQKTIFTELIGPNCTYHKLFESVQALLIPTTHTQCRSRCDEVIALL